MTSEENKGVIFYLEELSPSMNYTEFTESRDDEFLRAHKRLPKMPKPS